MVLLQAISFDARIIYDGGVGLESQVKYQPRDIPLAILLEVRLSMVFPS